MVRLRSLLSTVIGANLIIVKVGKKPHKILYNGTLCFDDYKRLTRGKIKWVDFEVTHLESIGNTLHVEVKEDTWK